MKIQELRDLIKDYPEDRLRLVITEMYRILPKKTIEAMNIDQLLKEPDTGKARRSAEANKRDFSEVKYDAQQFLNNAREGYYFIPNRVVAKKDRPKWRFVAKRLHKELLDQCQSEENLNESSLLLTAIYNVLCQGCGVYLFSSEDPFASVGIGQQDFYRDVVAVLRKCEATTKWIEKSVRLIIDNDLDRETIHKDLMFVLMEFLNTPPLKEQAIALCHMIGKETRKTTERSRDAEYILRERNNHLVNLVFLVYKSLGEIEAGITYFKQNYREKDQEVALYCLLKLLEDLGTKDLWLREYEWAQGQGIQPRESLATVYSHLKETGEFTRGNGAIIFHGKNIIYRIDS